MYQFFNIGTFLTRKVVIFSGCQSTNKKYFKNIPV